MLEVDVTLTIVAAIVVFFFNSILGFAILLMLIGYLTSKLIEASKKITSLSEALGSEDSTISSGSGS